MHYFLCVKVINGGLIISHRSVGGFVHGNECHWLYL